jgi:uncharacterized protein (DUF1697 family)
MISEAKSASFRPDTHQSLTGRACAAVSRFFTGIGEGIANAIRSAGRTLASWVGCSSASQPTHEQVAIAHAATMHDQLAQLRAAANQMKSVVQAGDPVQAESELDAAFTDLGKVNGKQLVDDGLIFRNKDDNPTLHKIGEAFKKFYFAHAPKSGDFAKTMHDKLDKLPAEERMRKEGEILVELLK